MNDNFLILLYRLIFQEDRPYISHWAIEVVLELEDWFSSLDVTFLSVFGGKKSPHLLLRYATAIFFMQEASYRFPTWLSGVFHMKKKETWLILPFQIGLYEIRNLKVANTKGTEIEKFTFVIWNLIHKILAIFARNTMQRFISNGQV